MKQLVEIAGTDTDQQRTELAKLLASGVIRVLLDRITDHLSDSSEITPQFCPEGLETT